MRYLDEHVVEGFRITVIETLTENIAFAVQSDDVDDEDLPGPEDEDFLQTAQDVTEELLAGFIGAVGTAYKRSIGQVDDAAIAVIFERLAVQAKINEVLANVDRPKASVYTRHGEVVGTVRSRVEHEGQDCLWITRADNGMEEFIPVKTIRSILA